MRTTINIEDDVLRIARGIANERGQSVGGVLSELAREGLRRTRVAQDEGGFPAFAVSERAPTFTTEDVKRAEDEF